MTEQNGSNMAGGNGSSSDDLGKEAGDRARATLNHAREDARALVERARASAESVLDRQKAEAVTQLEGLSRALRSAAETLEKQHQGPVARYAGVAAESLGDMAQGLDHQDLQTLLQSAKSMARRQPALFVGGAVAIGFGLARFLKSSDGASDLEPSETYSRAASPPASAPRTRSSAASKPRGRSRGRSPSGAGRGPVGAS